MKKIFFKLGLITYFLSGTLYIMSGLNGYQQPALIVSIIIIWLSIGMPTFRQKIVMTVTTKCYWLFVLSVFVSTMLHLEGSMFVTVIGLILIGLVSHSWLMAGDRILALNMRKNNSFFILSLFPLVWSLAYSLIIAPLQPIRYEGAFRTSNGMGTTGATLSAITLAWLLSTILSSRKRMKIIARALLVGVGVFFTLISTSRASTLSVACMAIAFTLILIYYGVIDAKSTKRIVAILIALLIAGLLLWRFGGLQDLVNNVLNKFSAKSNDTLDGRGDMWIFVLKRVKLFGNGETSSFGVHSTYFSMLDQYGIFSFISWILFCIMSLLDAMKMALYRHNTDSRKFLPLFVWMGFIIIGLAELMMLKTIMLICMVSSCISFGAKTESDDGP